MQEKLTLVSAEPSIVVLPYYSAPSKTTYPQTARVSAINLSTCVLQRAES